MDGIIVINKEKNMTSRDVVNKVCHLLNTKKVGHTGTLDPMATGVLVVAINKALKIVNDITMYNKEYEAEITLGLETDTLDITGNILNEIEVSNITNEEIDKVLMSFVGDYKMEVPKYSAIKVNGKKLYEYARNNLEVEIPVHDVKIFSIERTSDISYSNNKAVFYIKCSVSKGTYIRSLVRDIAKRLNTIGTMSALNRTKQGNYSVKDSYSLKDIEKNNYKLIGLLDIIDLPKIEVPTNLINKVKNGNKIDKISKYNEVCFILNNKALAVYKIDEKNQKIMRPKIVF